MVTCRDHISLDPIGQASFYAFCAKPSFSGYKLLCADLEADGKLPFATPKTDESFSMPCNK
jgi:hypothetical protein